MAFITNQWLQGDAIQSRGYRPIEVKIEINNAFSRWHSEHGIIVDLKLSKANLDYHLISLNKTDLTAMLARLTSVSDNSTKIQSAVSTLMSLSEEEFYDILNLMFIKKNPNSVKKIP